MDRPSSNPIPVNQVKKLNIELLCDNDEFDESSSDNSSIGSSNNNDRVSCEVVECGNRSCYYSPCCHVPLCEEHQSSIIMDLTCNKCNYNTKMCIVCFNISDWQHCKQCNVTCCEAHAQDFVCRCRRYWRCVLKHY